MLSPLQVIYAQKVQQNKALTFKSW